MNKWKAVYIERCTYGLEGSIWKPTIVIWQGAGCSPYDVDNNFVNKSWIKGRGYADTGVSIITEFFTPIVPKEYDFLEEIRKATPIKEGAPATTVASDSEEHPECEAWEGMSEANDDLKPPLL